MDKNQPHQSCRELLRLAGIMQLIRKRGLLNVHAPLPEEVALPIEACILEFDTTAPWSILPENKKLRDWLNAQTSVVDPCADQLLADARREAEMLEASHPSHSPARTSDRGSKILHTREWNECEDELRAQLLPWLYAHYGVVEVHGVPVRNDEMTQVVLCFTTPPGSPARKASALAARHAGADGMIGGWLAARSTWRKPTDNQ